MVELNTNEERPFYIQFETRPVENKIKSKEQGMIAYDDVDFVMVTLPGGRDVFENRVEPWFEQQEQYVRRGKQNPEFLKLYKKAYENWKEGQEIPLNGTPIKGWQMLTPAQQQTVISARIKTVEDLAKTNDEGLRKLGMGGRGLVEKAKSWLDSASSTGKVAMENDELKKKVSQLEITIISLEEKVKSLLKSEGEAEDIKGETEDINVLYEQKFGKPPHWKMKPETIRQKLEE